MFLLMATSEVFLLLGWVWRSDCLCSPTTFFKNCWIRRFPGLAIDLENSQRKGAHVIKVYTESTGQQCSQTCCLLKNGIDPDLLVFEKLSFKDMATRSSFNKWERHGNVRVADSEKCQDATTSSKDPPPEALSSAAAQELETNSKTTSTANDSMYKTASITYLGPTVASVKDHFTKVTDISEKYSSRATSENAGALPTSAITSIKMLSHLPSMAHLNHSKYLNETKGYGGRNYTSDDQSEKPAWEGAEKKSWLLPVMLCSSLILICCCSVFLATGCHQKKRGHYKPRRRGMSVYRQK